MSYRKILTHPHFWFVTGTVALDAAFFGLTDPDRVPSPLLILGFLLLVATVYAVLRGCFTVLSWYGVPMKRRGTRLARVVTGLAAGLIALQSVGQLAPRDVLVLLPLTVMAYLYATYGKTSDGRGAVRVE